MFLKRWHFDGETENDGEDQRVKCTVSLLIPKGGRNINTTLASKMVSMLAAAGRQTLSRKLQKTRQHLERPRSVDKGRHSCSLTLRRLLRLRGVIPSTKDTSGDDPLCYYTTNHAIEICREYFEKYLASWGLKLHIDLKEKDRTRKGIGLKLS